MSANLGNVQAGPQWSDLALSGADEGSTLSVCLAEEVNSTCEWECRVLARTEHGTLHVGSFRTRPPARGETPARLVAIAFFPGAKGWLTSWRLRAGGNARSSASAHLYSSSCPAGTLPGVTPMLSGVTAASPRVFTFNGAIGAAPVNLAPPGALLSSVVGQLTDPAGVAGFALLFDSAAAPVLGDVPIFSRHLGSAAGVFVADPTDYRYVAGAQGRPVTLGLWAAFSSTPDTFTPLGGNTFNATTEAGLP